MNEPKYRVIFRGEIEPGTTTEAVKRTLAETFKFDTAKVEKLFSGGKFVLKKDADLASCEKLRAMLKKAGAVCVLEPQEASESPMDEPVPSAPGPPEPPPIPTQMPVPPPPNGAKPTRRNDEKFCESCGEVIKINVLACPFCGKAVQKEKLGWLPKAAIGLAIGFVALFFLGMIAAIAVPNFVMYRQRAYVAAARAEMQTLRAAQAEFYAANSRYAADLGELEYTPENAQIAVRIQNADQNCYRASGTHKKARKVVWADCNGLRTDFK